MAITTTKTDAPDATSSAYDIQAPFWQMVDTILAGTDAIRLAGKLYLPAFPSEPDERYDLRLSTAKFTNIYSDIVENLAAKPMAKEVGLVEGSASERIEELCEDIDGAGNNLHVFISKVLFNGINRGIDWIYVDFPKSRPGLTVAAEKAAGLRPYWVHIAATDMLAVYSARIGGKEEFVHARWRETVIQQNGFSETRTEKIRVVERAPTVVVDDLGNKTTTWSAPMYKVYERVTSGTGRLAKSNWEITDSGPITLPMIPLVPFIAGRREGSTWVVRPPLSDCAYLQIQHYQQESGLKNISELTAFPMLSASGVTVPTEQVTINGKQETRAVKIPIGPGTILYAPPGKDGAAPGSWTFIEPTANSMRFLAEQVKATEQQMRELGRQPLTAQTGNLTVVTTAFAADKANSVAQAWALNLKDASEQALYFTCLWTKDGTEPEVTIDVDFDIGIEETQGPTHVIALYEKKVISKAQTRIEMKRYGVLSAEYDGEEDDDIMDKEEQDSEPDEGEDGLAAAIAALRVRNDPTKNPGDPNDPPIENPDDEQ